MTPRWHDWFGPPSGAVLSHGGSCRTVLWRTIAGCTAPPLAFAMLNPSTADATEDDPTIRRCLGYAWREGAGGIVVINLSPYRATQPRDLRDAHTRGVDVMCCDANNDAWARTIAVASRVVVGWGASISRATLGASLHGAMDHAAFQLVRACRRGGVPTVCLGRTKNGEPRHPLYVRGDAPLRPWLPGGQP